MDRPTPSELYNYPKGDYEAMIKDIEESNWTDKFKTLANSCSSVDVLWSEIKGKLHYLRDKFVPKIKSSNKPHWSSKGSVPLDENTRASLKEKYKLHRKWLKANLEDEKAAECFKVCQSEEQS